MKKRLYSSNTPPSRRVFMAGLASTWALPIVGCGGGSAGSATIAVSSTTITAPGKNTFRAPTSLANTATVPQSFSATLAAKATSVQLATGAATTVWAYNGMSPGPLIDVQEGDTVSIVFNNQLAQESTIHWHGLPVPPDQDGNPMDAVPPGGSKTYTFTLPKGSAGTYWYHPHPHMTTHQQVYMGLAGCFVVRPLVDPLAGIPERVMVVSDLRLDVNNQITANTPMDARIGREGNQLLVNGVRMPDIAVQPGTTERWRILNATNARYLRLALQGHTLNVVGHDGGLIEQAQIVTETLLAPAQRVELIVQASAQANQSFALRALAYDRGAMMASVQVDDVPVLTLSTTGGAAASAVALPPVLRSVAALGNPARTQSVLLTESMGPGMGGAMGGQFLINNKSFDPNRVDLVSRVNDVEDWLIDNQSAMDHPFHIHGTQFQVVSRTTGGITTNAPYRAWVDVVNTRAREAVRVRIQQTMPGKRMFHCHILEHEDAGMMGILDVLA